LPSQSSATALSASRTSVPLSSLETCRFME
jgi:hypothetical protein